MDVAILGASGDCGRAIAAQLISERLLAPTERLQLVGRADGGSARMLHGLISDLTDAYAEIVPEMDVALSPDEVVADVWVVACGSSALGKPGTAGAGFDRRLLAEANARLFAGYADALARHGRGTEIVVVVSNPVELAVAQFAQAVGRERVIGIGAFQDTLRFRREIAADLGVRRQRVGGFMIGEHGDSQVPVWSGVTVHGMERGELGDAIRTLRKGNESADFVDLCRRTRTELSGLIDLGEVAEAFRRLDVLPPDIRVVVKPFVTHFSGAKTALATANVTVELLRTLLDGRETLIAGQVMLEGDFYGLTGPLGVPIIASPSGVLRVVELPLSPDEERAVRRISGELTPKIQSWMESANA